MIRRIRTIDAHAAGEPLRLIVDGFPSPAGGTMQEKRGWLRKHADRLRRALMLEPRGHGDMYGAVLTEPVTPDADAGVLFMHNDGYSMMSAHGIVAVATIVLERDLLRPKRDAELLFDAPAGLVKVQPRVEATTVRRGAGAPEGSRQPVRVSSVGFANVPSFVFEGGVGVRLASRSVRADIAFGGGFYAIVDAESAGLSIDGASLPQLRAAGTEIRRVIEASHAVVHPLDPSVCGIDGTIFIGPARSPDADLRNVTVFADAQVDRSPCGTGIAAIMAVLDAMSLLPADRPLVHESIIGTTFRAQVIGRQTVSDYDAIVPEIEGSAWITGDHEFLIDDEDPLKGGFRL